MPGKGRGANAEDHARGAGTLTAAALWLILLSAVIHVGWNLIGKRRATSLGFYLLASALGTLPLLPVAYFYRGKLLPVAATIWPLIVFSGAFEALYYAALSGAYRTGEMSRAYPLARALPVLFTPAIALALGSGERLSGLALIGMALVFAGCVLLPLDRLASLRPAAYLNTAVGMAFIAAIGTTGYSLADSRAVAAIRDAWSDTTALEIALIYLFWVSLATVACLLPLCLCSATARHELAAANRQTLTSAGLMGVGIHLAYVLVLAAMTFARDVSYVVAFRQTSIPLGMLAGVFLLGEAAYPLKFVGSIVVFLGLLLVGLG